MLDGCSSPRMDRFRRGVMSNEWLVRRVQVRGQRVRLSGKELRASTRSVVLTGEDEGLRMGMEKQTNYRPELIPARDLWAKGSKKGVQLFRQAMCDSGASTGCGKQTARGERRGG